MGLYKGLANLRIKYIIYARVTERNKAALYYLFYYVSFHLSVKNATLEVLKYVSKW